MQRRLLFLGIIAFSALWARANADTPIVEVRIPQGLTAGFASTSVAADGNLYVTVPRVRAVNPNSSQYGPYDVHDFHLIADEVLYYPIVRPGFASLDLSEGGTVRPGQALVVTVSFEVPIAVRKADFEFIPHWFDNNGGSVAFCCYYQ